MMTYIVSERPDGRIVLGREAFGIVLQNIEAPEPSVIRRWIDGELINFPQYHESFSVARRRVNMKGLIETSEGWFRTAAASREYVRSRLGEAE